MAKSLLYISTEHTRKELNRIGTSKIILSHKNGIYPLELKGGKTMLL
jgi:hypothetical protein